MNSLAKRKIVHFLFDIGLIGKAIDGALEIVVGVVLLVVTPTQINGMVRMITATEINEDPTDFLAGSFRHAAAHLSSNTKIFAAIFLLGHGLIKVGLVWALFRKHWWAYPIAIVVFCLFVAYQVFRYSHTHSVALLALSTLDVFVIVLTWLEYQRVLASHEFHAMD